MKNYVVMDLAAGRRIEVQADSFTREEGVLAFTKGTAAAAVEVAVFAAGQWISVQEAPEPIVVASKAAK